MLYLSPHYARREHRGVAACHYDVAQLEACMAWNVVDVGFFRRPAFPVQIAEVASRAYGAADVRHRTEHRNEHRIVLRHEIDDAHHAHILSHAVGVAFVDGDEVVELVERAAHHLCRYGVAVLEHARLYAFYFRRVPARLFQLFGKLLHLPFKVYVALREGLVHIHQRCVPFKDLSRHCVRRREPHASLIAVVMKQQDEAQHLEQNEEEPVVVTCEEVD